MTLALPSRTDACYVNPNPRYIYKWSKDQSSNLLPDRHKIHTAARISFIFFFLYKYFTESWYICPFLYIRQRIHPLCGW